ncbi:MAG: serine/threonine-protein phosphatase, partial [Planctomycetes bacterium]|nr:serine/threonine-protein phosphatase [Planctomycetota bacterium]
RNWLPAGYAAGYCVAVKSPAGPLGTIWAFDRRDRNPPENDRRVLHSLASRIAAVLERVVLLRESDVQHRQQRDLNVASHSLPQDILRGISGHSGVDVAAVCTSRYELGGDLCELIALDDARMIVAVGDASGDSVPAAMVMSAARGAIRALCASGEFDVLETDVLIGRLNRTLHDITAAHQFMSLLFGVLDLREKSFTYTNAGHPAPLHIRDSQVTALRSHGMLLGVLAETAYDHSVVHLQAGDTLVAFSDGISEAMNPGKTMFRQNGIEAAVTPVGERTADQLLQAILKDLESHTAGSGSGDDRTLLVMRMR